MMSNPTLLTTTGCWTEISIGITLYIHYPSFLYAKLFYCDGIHLHKYNIFRITILYKYAVFTGIYKNKIKVFG